MPIRLADMKRRSLAVASLTLVFALVPSAAPALEPGFTKCARVAVAGGAKARVAARRVTCAAGREVARVFYQRIYDGDEWDGRASDGSIYYAIMGFRCGTGLGGSEGFCHHGAQRIDMSIRTDERFPY